MKVATHAVKTPEVLAVISSIVHRHRKHPVVTAAPALATTKLAVKKPGLLSAIITDLKTAADTPTPVDTPIVEPPLPKDTPPIIVEASKVVPPSIMNRLGMAKTAKGSEVFTFDVIHRDIAIKPLGLIRLKLGEWGAGPMLVIPLNHKLDYGPQVNVQHGQTYVGTGYAIREKAPMLFIGHKF